MRKIIEFPTTAGDVGASLVICAVTTPAGFYAFIPTDFRGVSELGLISGTGMFVSLVISFTLLPALLAYLAVLAAPAEAGAFVHVTLAIALIVPMGPMLYRVAFAPMAHASVLVLLIAAFGVHFSLMGLGLVFFGAEGVATQPLITRDFSLGEIPITGQSVAVVGTTALLLVFFVAGQYAVSLLPRSSLVWANYLVLSECDEGYNCATFVVPLLSIRIE